MHFTSKDRIFTCFLFSGVGKLINLGLSYCRANKFLGSVVDTAEQLVGGVVDTCEKFYVFWLFVPTTPGKNVIAGVNDTADKFFTDVKLY